MTSTPLCAWDLDGTLVDTVRDICEHVNRARVALGLPIQEEAAVRQHIGHGARELLRGSLGPAHEHLTDQAARLFHQSYVDAPVVHSLPFPGAVAALEWMRSRGVANAVVTNKPRDVAIKVLEQLKLLHHFQSVEGEAPGVARKPDVAMVRRAQAASNAGPTVLVGDSSVDWETAKAANIPFIGVSFGMDHGAALRALGVVPQDSLMDAARDALSLLAGLG